VPNNSQSAAVGCSDSKEAAEAYLKAETGNFYDAERIEAFLDHGPEMLNFFERETEVRFLPSPAFPDYHPTKPGGAVGGRSIVAEPFDAALLGREVKRLRPPLRTITFVGMMFNSGNEVKHFFNATKSLTSAIYVAKRLARHAYELIRYQRGMRLTSGNALAARLAKSAFDLNIPIVTETRALQLLRGSDGAVTGAVVEGPEGKQQINVRRGLVLACGGFPQDVARRHALFPHEQRGDTHLSPAPLGNTGDGIRMAEEAGGQFRDDLPNPAAWIPVSKVPLGKGKFGVFPHLIDRQKPGVIAVNRQGKRFCNESDSYHDVAGAIIRTSEGEAETAAWLVCDHRTYRKYGLGFAKAFPMPTRLYTRSGYLLQGQTLAELATVAGIDGPGLAETVRDFNVGAERGEDPEFGKGGNVYNRYLGDPDHQPNPCVAPVGKGPYYAVKVTPGDLGTFDGIRTDRYGRVLGPQGAPIPGLYAVGNDAASIMGGNYPGGGITLGPIMTFGYIAGRHLAEGG
jgi:succinate dehydrogenase/fumarate reductase flavoprotein subunit